MGKMYDDDDDGSSIDFGGLGRGRGKGMQAQGHPAELRILLNGGSGVNSKFGLAKRNISNPLIATIIILPWILLRSGNSPG